MLAVVSTNASPHDAMGLAKTCKHLRWYTEAREDLSQQLPADRVVRFLQIDEAHIQGSFPPSSEFSQSAQDEQHVDC